MLWEHVLLQVSRPGRLLRAALRLPRCFMVNESDTRRSRFGGGVLGARSLWNPGGAEFSRTSVPCAANPTEAAHAAGSRAGRFFGMGYSSPATIT